MSIMHNRFTIHAFFALISLPGSIAYSSDLDDQVQVVFKKHCITCHSEARSRGDLDMSTFDKILAGSSSGAVVVPGKPDESLLYLLASHAENPKMPPNAPRIPQREVSIISKWIAALPASPAADAPSTSSMNAMNSVAEPEAAKTKAKTTQGLVAVRPLPNASSITAIAINNDGSLAAVSGLHQVLLFNPSTAAWTGGLDFPEGDVFSLKFSTDGKKLYAAGGTNGLSGAVVCWDLTSYERCLTIETEKDAILAMDVSPDGSSIAVGGPTKTVQIYSLVDGKLRNTLKKHTDWVTSIAYSRDGVMLASGDRFGGVFVWEASTGTEFSSQRDHTGTVTGLAWSDDSNTLYSSGKDGFVQARDLNSETATARWTAHTTGIASLVATRDRLLSIGQDQSLSVWTPSSDKQCDRSVSNQLCCATITTDGSMAIAGDVSGAVHLVSLTNDNKPVQMNLPVQKEKVSPVVFKPKTVERKSVQVDLQPSGLASTTAPNVKQHVAPESAQTPMDALDGDSDKDLEETRRALASVQQSLKQTYQLAHELEETVARLKQLEAIQEARFNQKKLEQRTSKP